MRGKGLTTSERTGESRDKGLKTNGNPKTSGEQQGPMECPSWRFIGVRPVAVEII
jgi:hypothetical protein